LLLEEELLLSEILGKSREFLIAHPEPMEKLSSTQKMRFASGVKKLQSGIPLAYILGYKWFRNNKFFVNPNVLIPRPDTELLVDKVLELAAEIKPDIIADIGTGSGAIIISIAKELKKSAPALFATDISPKALAVARKNAKSILKSDNKIQFKTGSLLKPLKLLSKPLRILIVSNLPYLSARELKEPSIKYEPRLALYGGKVSHHKIEQLLKQISAISASGFAESESAQKKQPQIFVLLEINFNQGAKLKSLAKKYLPAHQAEIYKDLGEFQRVLKLTPKFF
jgi:release factor glutamine methyltransferase